MSLRKTEIDKDIEALHRLSERALSDGSLGGLMAATVYHVAARELRIKQEREQHYENC